MRSISTSALTAMLAVAGMAGCLSSQPMDAQDPPAPTPWLPPHTFIDLANLTHLNRDPLHAHTNSAHDHNDPKQHVDAFNIESLAVVPPAQGQRITELDIVGDYAYQCSGSGFRILDISNRSNPVEVSTYSGRTCADIKVTSDGAYAIIMGREIVDVQDKEKPVLVDEPTSFCHMCYIKVIGPKEYVFLARDKAHEIPFGSGVGIYELVREPKVGLVHVSDYVVAPADRVNTHLVDGDVYAHQVHDMTVYLDPQLNKTIMLAAYGDLGVRVVDVSNPAQPVEIGAWDDFMGDLGDVHTVGVDFIGGKRIIAAATENGAIIDPVGSASGYSAGYVYLLDATDLSNIVTLGKWINPGKHASGPQAVGVYSTHNIQFVQGRVYLAHYHAGVWVLDAASYVKSATPSATRTLMKQDDVPTWGFFFTSTETKSPNVWDVVLKDGYLYASDIDSGLHVLHFVGDPLGDPRFTSYA
jgi:hypothetical protein